MPSGAKKRKAAKKKLQKESHITNTTNNNGTQSQGNDDDPKSHDERECDGGEVERESSVEGVVTDHEVGTKEISLQEGNVAEFVNKAKQVESFKDVDVDDTVSESQNGDSSGEHKSSSSSSSENDDIAVEKGKSLVGKLGKVEQQGHSSDKTLEPAEYMLKEASRENAVNSEVVYHSIEATIPIEELVKQVVSFAEESNLVNESVPVDNSATSDMIESGLKSNVDAFLPSVDEKFETKVISVTGGGSGNSSEPVSITARDEEGLLPQSLGIMASDRCSKDDHVEDLEKHKYLEEQPLVSSAPLPVRRTSWMNCCGLFEVLSGGSSR